MSDAPSTGEHSGGEQPPIESDPFEPAAGHLGAAPPPAWARDSIPTPPPNWDAPSAEPTPGAAPRADEPHPKRSRRVPRGGPPPAGARSSTPWYAEPPAPFGPSRGGYRPATGPYWGRRSYPYSRRRAARRGMYVSPARNVVWLVVCIATLGVLFPVPAVICWIRAVRYRSPSIHRPPALAWLVWAVVFSVLSVSVYTLYIVVGATANNTNPSSSTYAPYVPPKTTTVTFGSTARVVADVGGAKGFSAVPVAITISDIVDRPHSKVRDVNLTTAVRVCASTAKVDPVTVGVGVDLVTAGGKQAFPAVDWPMFPDAFYGSGATLEPHHCVSGTIGYKLPAGAKITSFTYQDPRNNVFWRFR